MRIVLAEYSRYFLNYDHVIGVRMASILSRVYIRDAIFSVCHEKQPLPTVNIIIGYYKVILSSTSLLTSLPFSICTWYSVRNLAGILYIIVCYSAKCKTRISGVKTYP